MVSESRMFCEFCDQHDPQMTSPEIMAVSCPRFGLIFSYVFLTMMEPPFPGSLSIQEPEKWPDLALEDIFGPAARPISSESPKDGWILEVYSYMEVS